MQVFPFFTGCQRSGTTLVKEIFGAHPDLAVPPESQFIPDLAARRLRYERDPFDTAALAGDLSRHERFRRWRIPPGILREHLAAVSPADLPDAVRAVYALFAARAAKPRYADKTPRYATSIPVLAELFPESRFIHAIRDGRNVALSLLETPWGPKRIERGAMYWAERVEAARAAGARLGPARYLEYRYEDLLDDPPAVVARICTFIDLAYDEAMLRYHEHLTPRRAPHFQHLHQPPTKNLRDWRTAMPPPAQRSFEILAGDLLAALGYETVTDEATLGRRGERAAQALAKRTRMRSRVKAAQDSPHAATRLAARAANSVYGYAIRLAKR